MRADEPQVACRSAKPGWGAPARAAGAARAPNAVRCRADARADGVLLVLVFGGAGAVADADDAVPETLGAAGHVGAYAPTGARVGARRGGGRREDGEGTLSLDRRRTVLWQGWQRWLEDRRGDGALV